MPEPQEAIVVAHTHWDREWYLPFEKFRILLVELVDRVLAMLEAYPEFVFLLDGQTAVLDDYLAIRPDRREELLRRVSEGRLLVGPWYTQPDEFLVSGEALVRNLLYGLRKAEHFGGAMREGYVPDLFGHLAQLPQIFRGFGIESAFLMRGVGEQPVKSEFWWEGLDGSRVWTHRFPEEYGNAAYLEDAARLAAMTRRLGAVATTRTVLWMHGTDHTAPWPDVVERLRHLSAELGVDLRLGTLADYRNRVMAQSPDLESVRGELREGRHAFLLSNVLSARVYLKRANDRVQALLEQYAEPVSGWCRWLGGADPRPFLAAAWRLLLLNHAHDSIGGCSVDPVHREVEVRFDRAEQIAEGMLDRQVEALASRLGDEGGALWVYNPHPWPWRGRVEALVPGADGGVPAAVRDEQGRDQALRPVEKVLRSEDVLRGVRHVPYTRVAFYAEVPPLGYRVYRPVRSGGGDAAPGRVETGREGDGVWMRNEFLEATLDRRGVLHLLDRRSGHRYRDLLVLESEGDRGDEYTFMPVLGEPPLRSDEEAGTRIEVEEGGGDWATVTLQLDWPLPEGLAPDRRSRSARRVRQPITVRLTLVRGVPRLDVQVALTNRVRDHRLRVRFPLPGGRRAVAETAFGSVERPPRAFVPVPPPGWREAPSPDQPLRRFVAVEDAQKGLAVATRGLHEYAFDPSGVLYLTLVRSVGWLSRDDLSVRPGHAGPAYPTPEAQCLRPLLLEFSLIPYTPNAGWQGVWREALGFHAPARAWWLKGASADAERRLPPSASWLTIEPADLMLSALKLAEDGEDLILRLYNPTPRELAARVRFALIVPDRVYLADLAEAPREPLLLQDRTVAFRVRPWAIVTLRLVRESG